jgi:hypothetical protein
MFTVGSPCYVGLRAFVASGACAMRQPRPPPLVMPCTTPRVKTCTFPGNFAPGRRGNARCCFVTTKIQLHAKLERKSEVADGHSLEKPRGLFAGSFRVSRKSRSQRPLSLSASNKPELQTACQACRQKKSKMMAKLETKLSAIY